MFKEKLSTDLKDAMRAKDRIRMRTIRSLRAALLEKEIGERSDGKGDLAEDAAMAVVQKQAKQRRDSITQFVAAGREDLAETEREELAVIEKYLPEQLNEDGVRKEVQSVIEEVQAESMKDMGRVMGPAMTRLRGRADGRTVQQVVKELLSS